MSQTGLSQGVKALVLLEAIVCFGPVSLLLSLGFFMIPMQLFALSSEPLLSEGPLLLITAVVAGSIGMGTLFYVLWKLLRNEPMERPWPVLAAVLVALLPILKSIWSADLGGKILMGLPILASAHILYLSWPLTVSPGEHFPRVRDCGDFLLAALLAIVGATVFIRPGWGGLPESELLEKRSAWSSLRPDSYVYEAWPAGYPPRSLQSPYRIEVRDGRVTSATNITGVDPTLPPEALRTMDGIFDELLKALSQGHKVRARFDERWGYVQRAFVDTGDFDRDWDIDVRDFQLLPEKPQPPRQ